MQCTTSQPLHRIRILAIYRRLLSNRIPASGRLNARCKLLRYCYDVIHECKDPSTTGRKHERNCEECPTGLVTEWKSCDWKVEFKNCRNLDCFLCNNNPRVLSANGPCLERKKGSKIIVPRPHSAIFTSSTTNSFTSYTRCPTAQIYSSRLRKIEKLSNGQTKELANELLQRLAVVLKYV